MNRKRFFIAGLFLTGTFSLYGQLTGETGSINFPNPGKAEWQGYARSSFFGGGKEYDLAMLFAEASLRPSFRAGSAFLVSDIRMRTGYSFKQEFLKAEVKEFYGGFRTEKADFIAGNQIIAWGRCDGFNPTGNLIPRDYFFLSAEPDDQLMPNLAARIKVRFSRQAELDLVGIPEYKPSVYRFDLFDLGGQVSWGDPLWPSEKLSNGTLAARLNVELPAAGFSLSWFNGFDPVYGFALQNITWGGQVPTITYVCESYRKNAFGADFSLTAGSWILKGECAFNLIRNAGSSPSIPFSNFSYVAGVEGEFSGFHTVVQYIGQLVSGFSELREPLPESLTDPMALLKYAQEMIAYNTSLFNRKIFRQEQKSDHALNLNVSRSFGYDAWKSDLSLYYNFSSEEYFLRTSLRWNLTDALSLTAGCFLSGGPAESLFDYAGPILNGGFLEFKVTF